MSRRRDWQPDFLKALERTQMVSSACAAAGVARTTVYERRAKDPEFRAAWAAVEARVTDMLEAAAIRRAMQGSDKLLEMLLRARRPELFNERVQLDAIREELRAELVAEMDREIAALPQEARELLGAALAGAADRQRERLALEAGG